MRIALYQSAWISRAAAAGRHDPVADPCIHPGELLAFFAGKQQPVGIHFDVKAGAIVMPVDDVGEYRQ